MAIPELKQKQPSSSNRLRAVPPPEPSLSKRRIEGIDLARGIAIGLMILSHGVKGLLQFEDFPAWGLVPVHLITKFSSTLFILVFGISLAVVYLPHVGSPAWPRKRKRLVLRGLEVFFWYKALTIVEMAHLYSPEDILDTLAYREFPVYVEILGFYAIALLWIPFVLPAWKKASLWTRVGFIGALSFIAAFLSSNFDFWGMENVKALLVEHERHYTWGQLTRAPMVFAGLLLGETIHRRYHSSNPLKFSGAIAAASVALFAGFFVTATSVPLYDALLALAKNEGKHPPELPFVLFTAGGAFLILAIALAGGRRLATLLKPITVIGTNALQAFIAHIVILFVFYRYLFGYFHQVSYSRALALTGLLLLLTSLWVGSLRWIKK